MTAQISGRVQGVGFRAFAQREASRLGLTGVVWNNPDRTVGIIAEGDEESLMLFEQVLTKGSLAAHVKDIAVSFSESQGTHSDFSILRTKS